MDNTRVLACRIDEKLQKQMKQHIASQGKTVKEYIIGLIEEDLKLHAINTKENLNNLQEKSEKEKLTIIDKQVGVKEPLVKEDKKEEIKEQPVKEDKKEKQNEQSTGKEKVKEKQDAKNKKEESKKQPNSINKKVELNKTKGKKIQKEEEEEFE